jgi:hypothetical protein
MLRVVCQSRPDRLGSEEDFQNPTRLFILPKASKGANNTHAGRGSRTDEDL